MDYLWAWLTALPRGQLPWIIGEILVGLLVAALLLCLATRLVAGFYPPFIQALATLICAQGVSWIVTDLYSYLLNIGHNPRDFKGMIGLYSTAVFSQIVTYSLILREPGRNPIGMIHATILNLPQILLFFFIVSGILAETPKLPAVSGIQKAVDDAKRFLPSVPGVPSLSHRDPLADSQREALRRHPDLAIPGSRMNLAFLERYHRYQKERPDYFRDSAWPVRLADETASELR